MGGEGPEKERTAGAGEDRGHQGRRHHRIRERRLRKTWVEEWRREESRGGGGGAGEGVDRSEDEENKQESKRWTLH